VWRVLRQRLLLVGIDSTGEYHSPQGKHLGRNFGHRSINRQQLRAIVGAIYRTSPGYLGNKWRFMDRAIECKSITHATNDMRKNESKILGNVGESFQTFLDSRFAKMKA
jgi:hypothetical protein